MGRHALCNKAENQDTVYGQCGAWVQGDPPRYGANHPRVKGPPPNLDVLVRCCLFDPTGEGHKKNPSLLPEMGFVKSIVPLSATRPSALADPLALRPRITPGLPFSKTAFSCAFIVA